MNIDALMMRLNNAHMSQFVKNLGDNQDNGDASSSILPVGIRCGR
jgi:hypothetical protein